MQPLVDARVPRPTQMALALKLVTEMDLLRLKTIARLHARGLPPDMGWEDLLQEALTRVLTGARRIRSRSRRWPSSPGSCGVCAPSTGGVPAR
jgi:hypothetical protein